MKRIKLLLAGALALLIIGVVLSFILIPPLAKPLLTKKLGDLLHRTVTVEKLSFNPAAMAVSLHGVMIGEREGKESFFALEEMHLNVAAMSSLFRRAVIFDEVFVSGPHLRIIRMADGSYNFSDLIPKEDKKKDEAATDQAPPGFSINNIRIRGGSVDFDDRPNRTKHKIRELSLDIPFVSNLDYQAKRYVEPRLSALINDDAYILQGKSRPFSADRETELELEIRDLDLPHYLDYIPVPTAFRIPAAKLDAKLALRFLNPPQGKPTIRISGRITLREMIMNDLRQRALLRLQKLEIVIAALEPLTPLIHLTSVELNKPELFVRRDRGGALQLAQLFPGGKRSPGQKADKTRTSAQGRIKAGKEENKLQMQIDRLQMAGGAVTIFDEAAPAGPAKISLDPILLRLTEFSLTRGSKAMLELNLTVDKKGTLAVKGPIVLDPLDLQLETALRQLAIRSFQPYFADKVHLNIVRGSISAKGKLTVAGEKQGPPRIKYAGQLAVADFNSRDQAFGNDFVKWRMLSLDGIDALSQPFRLHISKVGLRDYFARVIINADGSLNLKQLTGKEQQPAGTSAAGGGAAASVPDRKTAPVAKAAAPESSPPSPLREIKIGRVDLDRGTIDFTDNFIKPNFSARMRNMTGSVTGLSSEEIARAAVSLRGNLERGSDILIEGRMNPLSQRQFADIAMRFKDIELSPATPYASKYLGHPILKGKLTFDVSYLVENGKLNAGHKVFIDQLTLGDRVESPDAIKAPVALGVSLLKDRHGQINLDIPVTGSLDDPEFSVWPIVWQIIVNIFTKALTAPFALLASLGGGGEELSYIEFDAGSAELNAAALTKISSLARALYEKPQVRLDIEGHADPVMDREGLKKKLLDRKVRERKLDDLIEAGKPAVPVARVTVAPGEYDRYLKRVYEETDLPDKPRNFLGIAKDIPRAEMERLLLKHAAVSDGDLRQLAQRRAETVKEQILKAGPVEPGRVFLVSSAPLAPEKKDKAGAARVDFRLK